MKYLALTPLLFLVACSTGGRAPIYDVKSSNSKSGRYVSSGKKVSPDQTKYLVHKGDTLYGIAWRSGMDVNTLIKRNKLKKPYTIYEGQTLILRNGSSKSVADSQNNKKSDSSSCTPQNCQENTNKGVVIQGEKAYSDSVVDEKVTKKTQVTDQKEVIKVADWVWPSKGKITKTFAQSAQGMKGISISNARGTPVLAAAAGQVVYAGDGLSGYGNLIIIKHNYDYLSAYAHNDKLLIKENEQVKMGQKIAVMGDSGTDSVRLHFDIRYRGKSVDPLRYLPKR